jgi:3-deoxy-D-manno-octulosonic-acid transferase
MFRITLAIYSLLQCLGVLARAAAGPLRRRGGPAFLPRLGAAGALRRIPVSHSATNLWIHAATAEEVDAARPVVEVLRQQRPDIHLFVSAPAASGPECARAGFDDRATFLHPPFDLRVSCRRYLRHIHPRITLLTGTEIRPNLIAAAAALSIPVVVIDGRVPDRSFHRYRRVAFLIRPLLRRISHFCMQSRQARERILRLGARHDRVNWVGDLRLDYTAPNRPESAPADGVERLLRRGPDDLLLVCAGIEPGEEDILIGLYRRLRRRFPRLRLLLAPRQADRADEIVSLLGRERIACARWPQTALGPPPPVPVDALVLDVCEHLPLLYEVADLVFLGGSLVPTGGDNPIAPAAFGKPILFGSHMRRFREISRILIENYAALQVGSPEELEARLSDLIADPHARRWLGRNARKLMRGNQDSVTRTAEIVRRYLEV